MAMDEWALLILVVLAFPVMTLVAFVLVLKHRGRIRVLEARVAALEAQAFGLVPETPPAAAPIPSGPVTLAPFAPRPPEQVAPPPEPALPPALHDVTRPPSLSTPSQPEDAVPPVPPRPGFDSGQLKERFAGFEEKVGARWTVWVGGLALALGGVFLVRFAVEQDLIGPAMRVGLGLLLAVALLAGGEVLRRRARGEEPAEPPLAPSAGPFAGLGRVPDVPSILTAAGTMTAFGSIYAAYELYHLIPPQAAFLLLAACGVATLLAALLHGPALAALGFIGAAVTPFLITSKDPNAWGVALLIAAVAASALAVARVRGWAWLAYIAIIGVVAWGLTLVVFAVPQAVSASGALGLVLLALTALLLAPRLFWGPDTGPRPEPISILGAVGALLVTAVAAVDGQVGAMPLSVFVLAAVGVLALAWRVKPMTLATLVVAALAPAILTQWVFPPLPGTAMAPAGPMAGALPEPARLSIGHFMVYAFGMGALMLGAGLAGAWRGGRFLVLVGWAVTGTLGPVLMLIAAYARLTELDRSVPFAALALALAFLFTLAAERLSRATRVYGGTIFAAGAVVTLALALTFALEKGWLTVGLALAALGVAWISTLRPLPGLRAFSAGLALVVLGRIVWLPTIAVEPGATPIFNWLLWGYGVPAFAFAGAAFLLAKTGDDWSRRVHESLALLFAVMLAATQVRHLAHGGDIYASGTRLFETGLLATIYGAYAVGLSRLATITGRSFYRLFSDLVAAIAALCALNGLGENNPFATGESVGGVLFNDLLVAFALPAVLALVFAGVQPEARPRVKLAAGGLAIVLALAYITFEVSRLFQGDVLDPDQISSAEWYAYSAAWLVSGMVLLGIGLWRGSRILRLASAAVMVLTVLKVFLSDMADLEGVLRAVSFIGLGVVLVAMGWVYQRLLAREKAAPQNDAPRGQGPF
ncbi:DUF2339 domain-containing protein [Xanthobacter oligotrophicus]|uniref:DUF2339 domain-containing protein n=1 Tax=Xanthobacter oligotrophicus TaxID=2607286 RepID=UPI00165D89AA|nr:DUF2339 domain-containing protein [Xanthobacter oligotrophicus]MCG5236537.1 DUF2339 domain-containing protein [Xanthobacter oligotrophicus]